MEQITIRRSPYLQEMIDQAFRWDLRRRVNEAIALLPEHVAPPARAVAIHGPSSAWPWSPPDRNPY